MGGAPPSRGATLGGRCALNAEDLRELDEVFEDSDADAAPRAGNKTTRILMLAVVSVLGLVLVGVALVDLVGPIWVFTFRSKPSAAEQQMVNFEAVIDSYRMINKRLPASLKDLTRSDERYPHPLMKRIPEDPWGNAYEYKLVGRSNYELRSCGEDGLSHTEDDITWPPPEEK
jgi:general secretion pathway protein G